jgi:hypothetical protein
MARTTRTAKAASRTKTAENTVVFRHRNYHPGFPASEQDDVLQITRKFKNLTPSQAAKLKITESELRNFAVVYSRLYLVPPTNRERLEAWRKAHRKEVEDWDVDGFFTASNDEEEGFVARKPGCPQEAVDELRRRRAQAERESAQPRKRRSSARRHGGNGDNQEVRLIFDRTA